MKPKYFIIGGTEKAGTTSLFEYFVSHSEFIPSKKKETDYFRENDCNLEQYLQHFPKTSEHKKFYLEASPGYLALADRVAPQIAEILKDEAKLVFILRDPIKRLVSSYKFHRSKLYIPDSLDINTYVKLCIDFEKGAISLVDTPFNKRWFLDVLSAGAYKRHLSIYEQYFKKSQLMYIPFEAFCESPGDVVFQICRFLECDETHFQNYDYFKSNQTFQIKNKFMHRISMHINNILEPFFRKQPRLKRLFVWVYRLVNETNEISGAELNETSLQLLQEYYKDDMFFLKSITTNWLRNKEVINEA